MLRADDEHLHWAGVLEVEHEASGRSRGWRLPLSRIDLFPGTDLQARAAAQAGVRVVLRTDSTTVGGQLALGATESGLSRPAPPPVVDVVADDELIVSAGLDADGRFGQCRLPEGWKTVELWLPQAGEVWLQQVHLDVGAQTSPLPPASPPRLITYGSSITHCYEATSPTGTWPARVARALGADLTCLGFSGQCHLDPMVARTIRDLPAEAITCCLGINVHGSGVFTERSFLPAVLGLLSTIRDGHPGTPILVLSPIWAPEREHTAARAGMTLAQIRAQVGEAVRLLNAHGDDDLHLLPGTQVLGAEQAHLLHDGVHPTAAGYQLMADRITPVLQQLLTPSQGEPARGT